MEFIRLLGAGCFLLGILFTVGGVTFHIINNQPIIITWIGVALFFVSAASYFMYDLNQRAE